MSQTVLTIQTLGFTTGAILFVLLLWLTRRAECDSEESSARTLAAAMGVVWNLGSLGEYVLRVGGYGSDMSALRLSRAVAYSGTGFLATAIFMMVSAAPDSNASSRNGMWRRVLPFSLSIGAALLCGFFATAWVTEWRGQFQTVMLLSAYNLGLHLAAALWLFRRQRERSGYRVALLLSVSILAVLLFFQIHFSWSKSWEMWLSVIAQQSSIPMALIALAWLSRFRFADLFVKQSFLLLAAVMAALVYQWFVVTPLANGIGGMVARGEAARWIVSALLWAALLLLFPWLRRRLLRAADLWIFERPDFRSLLAEFQQASSHSRNETELFELVEQYTTTALRAPVGKVAKAETASAAALPIRDETGVRYALELVTEGKSLLSDEITLLNSIVELAGRRLVELQFERERREQALREAKLQQLLTAAELKALRAQINPHFLFNTLNTIADLISEAPEKAEQLTERLAEVFRYALSRTNGNFVALAEEFAFLRTYLEIEQARFGERLRVELDFDPALATTPIPSLLLQPLAENAVKHGLAAKPEGGTLRVAALRADAQIKLIVADDGNGWRDESANGHRIGLQNVTERLHTFYGETARLEIQSAAGRGTTITITIPKDETQNAAHRRRSVGALAVEEAVGRTS